MLAYIVRRLLWLIPVLLLVAAITFTLMHLVPGGPWDRDKRLPEQAQANVEPKYGLDKPLWRQFTDYLLNLVQGDLGVSYRSLNRPVRDILWDGGRVSATLGFLALGIAVLLGVSLGVLAALRQNTVVDYASVTFATFGASIP